MSNHRDADSSPSVNPLLPPGTRAPNFTLHVTPDQSLALTEFIGRPVILAFYPADFSPVCGDQMALYNEALPVFQEHGAELLGISVDGVWLHNPAISTFRCSPTSSPKAPSPGPMEPTARRTALPIVRCS
jgi:hypothetical protein